MGNETFRDFELGAQDFAGTIGILPGAVVALWSAVFERVSPGAGYGRSCEPPPGEAFACQYL
jgi:hypothetical protein